MPFTLQSSGNKVDVASQVNGQITATYDAAPKGQDREDVKAGLEKIRDFIFKDLGGDYPDESPMGLILVGDAGKNYVSITRLELSLSKPAAEADTTANPIPEKDKPVDEKAMTPPAPDKKPTETPLTSGKF